MSLQCPHCGILPQYEWMGWSRALVVRQLTWTKEMTLLVDCSRLEEETSSATVRKCPTCKKQVIFLEAAVPWSDETGDTDFLVTTPKLLKAQVKEIKAANRAVAKKYRDGKKAFTPAQRAYVEDQVHHTLERQIAQLRARRQRLAAKKGT